MQIRGGLLCVAGDFVQTAEWQEFSLVHEVNGYGVSRRLDIKCCGFNERCCYGG